MRGLLTRRRFATTAVAAVVGTMVLAACGGTTASPTASGATQNPAAIAGGNLNLGVWQPQNSFLNAGVVDSQTFSYLIDAPSAEGLLWYRSGDETASAKSLADYWQPWLATEVPTTANGDVKTSGCPDTTAKMCVTWKLRTDVTWHDGHKFDAHDVCDTFQFFYLKYGNSNPTALISTSGWDQVSKCIESSDKATATVEYKSQYGPYLSLGTGTLGVLPGNLLDQAFAGNSDIEKFKFKGVDLSVGSGNSDAYKTPADGATMDVFLDGTGPYVMKSYDANNGVVYVVNKKYWNTGHAPHIATLNFKFEADLTTEVTAIQSGSVDMAFDMRLYNLKGLNDTAANGKLTVQAIPDSGAEKVDLNICDDKTMWVGGQSLCGTAYKHSPYLANKDVRHAILEAINRPGIVQSQTANKASIPKDSFLYLGAEYIDSSEIPTTAYDPKAANDLLDKAGFKYAPQCEGGKYRAFSDGSCISLSLGTTKTNPSRVATEPLIQADLAAVGIKVTEPYNNGTNGVFFGSFSDGGTIYTHNFDMAMYTNTMSAPAEPDGFYGGYVGCYDSTSNTSPTTIAACSGDNGGNSFVPAAGNKGNGQNDTGINIADLNAAMAAGRSSVDLSVRTQNYIKAEKILADEVPEVPLYRQVTVDAYGTAVQGVLNNDIVWDYNTYDWYCTKGNCQTT